MTKKAPRAVRRAAPGRVLAAERLVDDTWAIVSTDAFAVVTPAGEVQVQRPWHEVATGEWDGERHVMTISWVDGERPTRIKTVRESPVHFPRTFKERVDASVVYSDNVTVPGGELRGALRRTPSGELISQISSDVPLEQTPALEEQIVELERKMWEFVGI